VPARRRWLFSSRGDPSPRTPLGSGRPPWGPPLLCCGLTWISTGQLGVAQRVLRRTIKALLPDLRAGVPVVVLEPSCAAVFRADAAELLGSDDARLLAKQTRTLAELLVESGWQPDGLLEGLSREGPGGARSTRAIAQVHCHQHAVMGFDADRPRHRHPGRRILLPHPAGRRPHRPGGPAPGPAAGPGHRGLVVSGGALIFATRMVRSSRSSSWAKLETRLCTILAVSAAERPARPASSSARLSSK